MTARCAVDPQSWGSFEIDDFDISASCTPAKLRMTIGEGRSQAGAAAGRLLPQMALKKSEPDQPAEEDIMDRYRSIRAARPHWIEVEVTAVIRGHQIDRTTRVYLRDPAAPKTAWTVIARQAIRQVRRAADLSTCTPFRRFNTAPRDWSDTVEAAVSPAA